jgi:hypothetical protein
MRAIDSTIAREPRGLLGSPKRTRGEGNKDAFDTHL